MIFQMLIQLLGISMFHLLVSWANLNKKALNKTPKELKINLKARRQ